MELGNMSFGNSRGNFPIADRMPYQEAFSKLLWDAKGNARFDETAPFANDIFSYEPYYWGECDCSYLKKMYKWFAGEKHLGSCFHYKFAALEQKLEAKGHDWGETKWELSMRTLAMENGVEYDEFEMSSICDCGWVERFDLWRFQNHHDFSCSLAKPNFVYKPSGFSIQWYKYPLRDSYTNFLLPLENFKKMIRDCINSLEPV